MLAPTTPQAAGTPAMGTPTMGTPTMGTDSYGMPTGYPADGEPEEVDYKVTDDLSLVALAKIIKGRPPFPGARVPTESDAAHAVRLFVQDRKDRFWEDAEHKRAILRIENGGVTGEKDDAMEECDRLYSATMEAKDTGGNPLLPISRPVVDELYAFAISGVPKGELDLDIPLSLLLDLAGGEPGAKPDAEVVDLLGQILDASKERLNAVLRSDLKRGQWPDLVDGAYKDATVMGVGWIFWTKPGVISTQWADHRRLLRDKQGLLDPARQAALERGRRQGLMERVDPREVFCQAGVRSAFSNQGSQEMLRLSRLSTRKTKSLNRSYGRTDIAPGTDEWGLCPHGYAWNGQYKGEPETGVVTSWEIVDIPMEDTVEKRSTRVQDGEEVRLVRRAKAQYMERYLVRSVFAGDTLLEVDCWTADEGSVSLPGVPLYVKESANDPYGFRVLMALKRLQDMINRVILLIYETGSKSLSNQGGILLDGIWEAGTDVEALVSALKSGEIVRGKLKEELVEDGSIQNVRDFFISTAQATASLTPALMELLALLLDLFKRASSVTDMEAVARARTSIAKQAEVAISDRQKSPILTVQAKSVEEAVRVTMEQRRDAGPNELVEADGRFVLLNEKVKARLTRKGPGGEPIFLPPEVVPVARQMLEAQGQDPALVADDGRLLREVEVTIADTSLDFRGTADSRTMMPQDPAQRIRFLTDLMGVGVVKDIETVRHELPAALRDRDDRNAQATAEAQRAAQQAALQQQLMMMGGGGPAGMPEGEAASPVDQKVSMLQNAVPAYEEILAQLDPNYQKDPTGEVGSRMSAMGLPLPPGSPSQQPTTSGMPVQA